MRYTCPVVYDVSAFKVHMSLTRPYESHVDEKNRIVTSPAYMCETAVHEVFDGIGNMIENVVRLSKK